MTQRLHALVAGRVQGVGYRDFVRREARRLGLAGWTANRPDGRVEVVAEGPDEALEALAGRLKEGPAAAAVSAVEAAREHATGEFEGFQVRSSV